MGKALPWRSRLRAARTLFVHRWHAAQTIGEWFGNEAVGERFEHINHVRSLAQYVWRYGPFREDDAGTGRVPEPHWARNLGQIVRPVAKRGREHFEMAVRYAARFGASEPSKPSSRGVRRNRANTPPRRSADASVDLDRLVAYALEHPDVGTFAKQLVALHRAMLRYYVQMRYLTPGEAEAFRRSHIPILTPLTSPVRHPAEAEDGPAYSGPMPGDLSEALLGTFARNIYQALACRARSELFKTLMRNAEAAAEIAVVAKRIRIGPTAMLGEWAAHHSRFVTSPVVVDGRRMRFEVRDRALASMLMSLNEKSMPLPIRWLAAFKTAVSAMITAMPVFIVKNFFRDTLAGFVAGRYATIPFLGTLGGGVHAIRDLVTGRSEPMHEYLLQGGFYSGLVESETYLADVHDDAGRVKKGRAVRRAWIRLVYWATRPAWISEAGTRVDQFRRARRAGATNYAASRAARMVSSDFANIGSSRGWRMYVHTVPFLNAAIQGLDQLYQVFRQPMRDRGVPRRSPDQRAHIRKAIVSGACLTAMSCAAWVFNASSADRREAYHAETDYEKASWVTLYDVGGGSDVRIPVPFQIGAAFIKLPEVVLDLAARRETLAGPKFVWSLVHGNLAVGWIPAVAQPMVEIYTNRNFFGNEIIPPYMVNWEPERQFFDRSTPLPYRSVGAAFNVSPLHVQTVVRGWTGHLGNAAVTALDEVMWDDSANGPKPFPRTLRLLTGIHSLQPPQPRTYTRFGNEFYEISDWATGRARSVSCRGDSRVPAVCAARALASRTSREASELRRRGDQIRMDLRRTREAKERELVVVYAEIDKLFRLALPDLRGLQRLELEPVARPVTGTNGQRPRPSRPTTERTREPAGPAVPPGACGLPGTVDVNRASVAELDRLPGVGPVIAGRIVAEREEGGPFSSYLDLQRVRGIGPVTVERMRGIACAGR
ncbi:MAG: helix-hairpin-helix domain-containing protein [Gemmatimonadetes bacterium]|nr:helix-hairpin-helix domain-containing protein [Gemmatimonadota bacterium]